LNKCVNGLNLLAVTMRTEQNISQIVENAKIIYSYKLQGMEIERMRGINQDFQEYFEISNILNAMNVTSTIDKNYLCDVLVRKGYVTNTNNLLFSESIYNKDFDTIN